MNTKNKIFLVTGGLGHIGSSLTEKLLDSGHTVLIVDDLSTQRFPSLFGKLQHDSFYFINQSVQGKLVPKQIKNIVEELGSKLDAIIHLSAQTDAATSFDREQELKANNIASTDAAISIAEENNCQLIYPSSTSVYGENSDLVTEDSKTNPQSPYAESKLIEEAKVLQEASNSLILRLGTIAGPSIGMRFHTAVNSFIWKAMIGQPVTIWKTALDQKRPYLCLSDAVLAFEHSINNNLNNKQIYNVLTENSTPRLICQSIKEVLGEFEIEFVDSRIMNQLTYEVSSKKFEDTGFEFLSSLDKAINETVNFLRHKSI